MGLFSSKYVSLKFHNKSWSAFSCQIIFRRPFSQRGAPIDHLAAKDCPGFVAEFTSYSINGEESNVAYLSLAGSAPYALIAACCCPKLPRDL